MAQVTSIVGKDVVLGNLRRWNRATNLKVGIGLKRAGLWLQGKSQRLVPVDTGNLRASAFTRATGIGSDTVVRVGYTAAYAIYVHEAVGMVLKGQPRSTKGKYWDPQGRAQAKFLEEPARTERDEMRRIVQISAKI